MSINQGYDEVAVIEAIAHALDEFYTALVAKIDNLDVSKIMKRKNPYLFRAKAMNGASEIVDAVLSAFVSSSEETIFGNTFFEPIAVAASQGVKALAEGVDIMVDKEGVRYALAVKSGTSVFNAASKKKQEQNFTAASKLAQQARLRFVPIIGYCYGKRKNNNRGIPKLYAELAGQEFWKELTGDETFYIKLIQYMYMLPENYLEEYRASYQRASNRLLREFTIKFCTVDGRIDWEKLVKFNSGNE